MAAPRRDATSEVVLDLNTLMDSPALPRHLRNRPVLCGRAPFPATLMICARCSKRSYPHQQGICGSCRTAWDCGGF